MSTIKDELKDEGQMHGCITEERRGIEFDLFIQQLNWNHIGDIEFIMGNKGNTGLQ